MMKLIIFNVEQGQCIYLRTPGDYGILIDCGKGSSGPAASPAEWLAENEAPTLQHYQGHPIASMILTHPHEGHLADISTVVERLSPAAVIRDTDHDWQAIPGLPDEPQPDLDLGARVRTFSLSRQEAEELGGDAQRTINNRSIVTVISYNSSEGYAWKVVVAGDNETDGWEVLLAKPEFRAEIADTDFFVASHHGHESGFSADLFRAMGKPLANIISTREGIEHVDDRYRKHGQGVKFPDGTRTHFVTREDGNITIQMNDDGTYDVWLYTPASGIVS